MARELRMTRLFTELCHEVTDSVRDKADLIKEVKELGVAAQGSDSMAFLRILRDEDLDKAKYIMNLLKETQKHTREKEVTPENTNLKLCSLQIDLVYSSKSLILHMISCTLV
ncbi:hypothetical protein Tco_0768383 [Tanacetum coccineum]